MVILILTDESFDSGAVRDENTGASRTSGKMAGALGFGCSLDDLTRRWIRARAGKSKSLICWKRLKGGKRRKKAEKGRKGEFDLQLDFWQKKSTSLVKMS